MFVKKNFVILSKKILRRKKFLITEKYKSTTSVYINQNARYQSKFKNISVKYSTLREQSERFEEKAEQQFDFQTSQSFAHKNN